MHLERRRVRWTASCALAAVALAVFACTSDKDSSDADAFGPLEPIAPAPACPAPGGAPRNVLSAARLTAEGTSTPVLRWNREDRDGITTVRDDVAETGWLTNADTVARAEIDFGPLVGRPVALRAVELAFTGARPRVQVRARAGCGGPLVARAAADTDRVELGDVCATCVEVLVISDGESRLTSLRVESADETIALPNLPAPPAAAPTLPHPRHGVVEGFYGVPWTWGERERMIDTLTRGGQGLYIYAPKRDPLHRAEWRKPYGAEFVTRFGELARFARGRGARAVFAISPFLDFKDGSDDDLNTLVAKLRAFVDAGVDGVAIFADDIEFDVSRPIDGALGALHTRVVNRALAKLREAAPNTEMWFVGTVYDDVRLAKWATGPAYLEALRELEPSVHVLWTGKDTFSPTLAASDLTPIEQLIGRKTAIWDNFWANDGGDGVFGRVNLGTYAFRNRDLSAATTTLVQNPLIQGGLARLAVGTFVGWREGDGPTEPTVDAMRAASVELELAHTFGASANRERDAAVLRKLLEMFEGSSNSVPEDVLLARALDRMREALRGGQAPSRDDVRTAALRLAAIRGLSSAAWHSGVAGDIADELDAVLVKPMAAADLALDALARVEGLAAGEDVGALTAAMLEKNAALEGSSRFRWTPEPIERFVAAVRDLSTVPARVTRPALGDALPPCEASRELSATVFQGAREGFVFGLPGASFDGTTLRFTPPHAGRYEAVLVAFDAGGGHRVRIEKLTCTLPR
jgi:hypothetical protein